MSGLLERAEARVTEAVAHVAARLRSERPDESARWLDAWLDWSDGWALGVRNYGAARHARDIAHARALRALGAKDECAHRLWCKALGVAGAAMRWCMGRESAEEAAGEAEGLLGIEPEEAPEPTAEAEPQAAPAPEAPSAPVSPPAKRRRAAATPAASPKQADLFGGRS